MNAHMVLPHEIIQRMFNISLTCSRSHLGCLKPERQSIRVSHVRVKATTNYSTYQGVQSSMSMAAWIIPTICSTHTTCA
jgi:hypothetical protein